MRTAVTTTLTITAAAALCVALTACTPDTGPEPVNTAGATVAATGFERDGANDPGTHYAECATPNGQRYRVQVSAAVGYSLTQGQPCPHGPELPMPDPAMVKQLQKELTEPLPYEGGNANDPKCGAWGTVDKQEARRLAAQCPPLTRGDLR